MMNKVVLDTISICKLNEPQTIVSIYDEQGQYHGYFIPASDADRSDAIFPIPVEELQRRARKSTGRPLKDILADLEKLTENEQGPE